MVICPNIIMHSIFVLICKCQLTSKPINLINETTVAFFKV